MQNNQPQLLYHAQEMFITNMGDIKPLGFDLMLCGGTALARAYLHHRISYDLDFFVDGQFDPDRLAVALGKLGIKLDGVQIESGGRFVHQLVGFSPLGDVRLKVSFIEDSYAGMFPRMPMPFGQTSFMTESIEGLYHRKLRTVSGSGNSDKPTDGRQAARDLFDLFMLDRMVHKIPAFVQEINQNGANFPAKAFVAGLAAMPWIDMMDEFAQMEVDVTNPHLTNVNPLNMMAMVRARMQEVFKEMA